jgi:hypothetical protein
MASAPNQPSVFDFFSASAPNTTQLTLNIQAVRMKESANGYTGRWLIRQHSVYCGEVALRRGTPVAYRVGVDKRGGWRSLKKVTK